VRNSTYWMAAIGVLLPSLAIAGGNAAGGGVRSVSVDFMGLELALVATCWLATSRI